MPAQGHRCRLCGEPLVAGLLAGSGRTGCLSPTPIVGVCPEHGPVGRENAVLDTPE